MPISSLNSQGKNPTPFTTLVATGGSVFEYSQNQQTFKSHTFTSTSTFAVTSGTNSVDYLIVAGGGGGGGLGGAVAATGVFPAQGAAGLNTNGQNGLILYKPTLMLYGGRGAGGATSGNGGNGGNGAPGAGGGGGGGSVNVGVNAGNGGRGGDGFVIITTSL
jgi:hypothetical protein